MIFLIDAQLLYDLALTLTNAGHTSKALRDVGLREAEDEDIWNYAMENGFCVITKDADFANRILRTKSGPPVVWLRIGNCRNQVLRERLMLLLDEVIARIDAGDRLIEIC